MNQKERYVRELSYMTQFELSEEYKLQIKEQRPGYNIRIFAIEDAAMKFGGIRSVNNTLTK